ncbi:TetR/AcrR family transcriptional regulator [Chondromyces apiculatus]|uniref:Transcriptional regulator, TetR family n=1 Tax=Chondromyces apiculatus DSM 436 TaxID=1192034 RepID=A0A017SZ16_9BACT|nr:TetR/AcrR family transcriptional regulator [Chondromyces apiculatus]EYF01855.1 Transcriptional regulator, TetR family [Chondromyces apiculatus DSM 436]
MTAGTPDIDTRTRLLDTALKLFSEHGMEGASLQMIADHLGVTKAAVYYHFKTKDEIAEAVAAPAIQQMIQIVHEASLKRSRGAQRDHALAGFVDLIVRHRMLVGLFNSDPWFKRIIDRAWQTSPRGDLRTRMKTLFAGPDPSIADAITVHIVLAGLGTAGGAPEFADLDDDTLRQHLLDVGRRLLGRPRRSRQPLQKRRRKAASPR